MVRIILKKMERIKAELLIWNLETSGYKQVAVTKFGKLVEKERAPFSSTEYELLEGHLSSPP
jgi:hypothetical protein